MVSTGTWGIVTLIGLSFNTYFMLISMEGGLALCQGDLGISMQTKGLVSMFIPRCYASPVCLS